VTVADILTAKGSTVFTIKPSESVGDLSKLLREKRIGAAVVSNDGRSIDGVISERDIAYGLSVHKADLPALRVSALMTRAVVTCSPGDDAAKVASMMLSRNIRHIPVYDGNGVIGMVSIRDVLKVRLDELQRETAQLRSLASQTGREPEDR
jgi:CBS domain-containing protein